MSGYHGEHGHGYDHHGGGWDYNDCHKPRRHRRRRHGRRYEGCWDYKY